jgi:CD109 antigen
MGGFSSTQDTVIALQALSRFAVLTSDSSADQSLSITLFTPGLFSRQLTVNRDNYLLLQTTQIPPTATGISVDATGTGVAIVQLTAQYNVKMSGRQKRQVPLSYDVQANVSQTQTNTSTIALQACAKWSGTSGSSGMAILEIALPTGYQPVQAEDVRFQSSNFIKLIEYNEVDGTIVVYLDQLTVSGACANFTLNRVMLVSNVQPAAVQAYLYYDPDERDVLTYVPVISSQVDVCVQCQMCCQNQPINYFTCSDGTWLDSSIVCNGIRDCSDGADEHGCPETTSAGNAYFNRRPIQNMVCVLASLWLTTALLVLATVQR